MNFSKFLRTPSVAVSVFHSFMSHRRTEESREIVSFNKIDLFQSVSVHKLGGYLVQMGRHMIPLFSDDSSNFN